MHRFTLWAPHAERVEVLIGDTVYALSPDREMPPARPGWWAVEIDEAGPGTDYLFSVDGGPGRPDPRSAWQPDGPDGPSRLVDHGAFAWTDDDWRGVHLPSAVLYELHVGTFTEEGTFESTVARLPHLVDLGIDAVELLPVAEASGTRGWGYDGVDWYAPHHRYGGPDGLKRLVDAAHELGLGVVLDVVYNHLGPAGNYLAEFGPYFSDEYRTNWGPAINFDGAYSDEVRRFVIDNARMWLSDYHMDGLRLDAVHAIYDKSSCHVLDQMAGEVRRLAAGLGRPLFLIAESDLNAPRFVRPHEVGGYGLDSAWADEFHHALHGFLTGEESGYYEDFGSLAQLATALERAWVYAGDWSPHRRRTHGSRPEGLSGDRFVVFLQNHDQVGNRAAGERISQLTSFGRCKVAAALTLLSPFVPLLFAGEEWFASTPFQYFTDHHDEELAGAVSEGRRGEFASFGWSPEDVPDPQDFETYARSCLDWDEVNKAAHAEMLEWYRTLIALRHNLCDLAGGDPTATRVRVDEGEATLVLERPGFVLVANFAEAERKIVLAAPADGVLASSDSASRVAGSSLVLAPDSVVILATA